MQLDYTQIFNEMHPGFFDRPYIRTLDEDGIYDEMVLDLRTFPCDAPAVPAPEGLEFSIYEGSRESLLDAVRSVDEAWPVYFQPGSRVFCARSGGRIASFCLIEDMGTHQGMHIGGPGCVGTVPSFRRQGIGLRMVQLATALLKNEAYDLSYIHFTAVSPWYSRLGYRTVLSWNRNGLLRGKNII